MSLNIIHCCFVSSELVLLAQVVWTINITILHSYFTLDVEMKEVAETDQVRLVISISSSETKYIFHFALQTLS